MVDNLNAAVGPPEKKSRKWLMWAAGGCLVLLVCVCVGAGIGIFIFDPYSIVERITGTYDPIAERMPADIQVYARLDMGLLTAKEATDVFDAFSKATEQDQTQTKDATEQLDDSLKETYGITYTDDIKPWVGQYIGFGLSEFTFPAASEFGASSPPDLSHFMLAVESRNAEMADSFIDRFTTHLEENGSKLSNETYNGTTIYVLTNQQTTFAVARSGDMVFLAGSADEIKRSLDVKKENSLAKNADYQALLSKLPSGRAVTLYASEAFYGSLSDWYGQQAGGASLQNLGLNYYKGLAASVVFTGSGIQIDAVAMINAENISPDEKIIVETPGSLSGKMAERYPEDTFTYINGAHLDALWRITVKSLTSTPEMSDSFNQSLAQFEQEVGFNPDTDLFPILDGEYALGLYPSGSGYLAENAQLDMGMLIMVETSDPQKLGELTDTTAGWIGKNQGSPVEQKDIGEHSFYLLGDPNSQQTFLFMGMADEYLMIGTDETEIETAFSQSASLATSEEFKEAQALLGMNQPVTLYLDMAAILDLWQSASPDADVRFVEPIRLIVVANDPLSGDMAHSRLVVSIETAK